jgi:cytochrome c biogenesis protein CcdA
MSNTHDHHTAGAFDIRNIIGGLLGVFGLILLLTGLLADARDGTSETSNVWTGLILVVIGIVFLAWARLKPVVVPDEFEADTEGMDKPPV